MPSISKLRNSLLLVLLLVASFTSKAQQTDSTKVVEKNNIIKINVAALVVKNFSIQYERKVGRKTTLAINGRIMPFGNVPFNSSIQSAIDDPSVKFDQFKVGITGVTAELKWYVGKKGAFRGFYLAPFVNYNQYKSEVPVTYMNSARTGIFTGNNSSLTGGLQLGAQWRLGNHLYLDWWIIGPNYGNTKGDLVLKTPLDDMEQISMQIELDNLKQSLPFDMIESYKVTASGATVVINGPWAGIRAMGFGLGYRF